MKTNVLMAEYPVTVSNLDKVLWPEQGITKAEYIHYMIVMSRVMLRHYENRLLTVIRYPHGIHEKSFYQKNVPSGAPDWIQTYPVWSDDSQREIAYMLANNTSSLIWLANQAAMELHLSYSLIDKLEEPTNIAFDLDPTVKIADRHSFRKACQVALLLKEVLDDLGLQSYPKTSGATGLQVFVPIAKGYTFADTRQITHFLGNYLVQKAPDLVTIERLTKDRGDKVYFDYLQHHQSKTLSGPYTPRAVPSGAVSAPLAWEEIKEGVEPHMFTLRTMPKRIEMYGDLFEPMSRPGVDIKEIIHFIKNHPKG
ncbi:DNA polymerase domain-containing protein [Tumebacillus algifaecis]|uniref:DNA polymerase domain-containing protein n=1 Tax=Tumebacillus algifaecis TaxID=1214604 RepID=A0A223D1C5_9BACL|nr:non-homologous end-joining DNA ligase [Tumebacillus algifaecis]ASS75275.1 DNA polymerase domain-containing protein [Tumebacillus algifaecis]